MKITRAEAIRIIKTHGWEPDQPTAVRNGEWVPGTDFLSEMGDRPNYDHRDIREWLGH